MNFTEFYIFSFDVYCVVYTIQVKDLLNRIIYILKVILYWQNGIVFLSVINHKRFLRWCCILFRWRSSPCSNWSMNLINLKYLRFNLVWKLSIYEFLLNANSRMTWNLRKKEYLWVDFGSLGVLWALSLEKVAWASEVTVIGPTYCVSWERLKGISYDSFERLFCDCLALVLVLSNFIGTLKVLSTSTLRFPLCMFVFPK